MSRAVAIGLILIGGLIACSHPPKMKQTVPEQPTPSAIVVDTVIDGSIFGQPLSNLAGAFIDAHGALIVCDEGNNRVIRFSPSLKPELESGGRGSADGLFNAPVSGGIDGPLSIRIVDRGNKRICRLDSRLQYVDELTLKDVDDPLKFGSPEGAVVDKSGNIWVSDRDNNRIAVFSLVGQFDRFIGEFGFSGGGLLLPGKLAVDRHGAHYVCDAGNKRIVVYDEYGNFDRDIVDPDFREVSGFCVDNNDRVWVVDRSTSRIFLFSPSGERLLMIEPSIAGLQVPLRSPSDIVVMANRIVVIDSGNDRIVVCRTLTAQE